MSQSVIEAYQILNRMRDKAVSYSIGSYRLERIEQALDYLLNSPQKEGDPKTIVRDVLGSAGSKIRNRINLLKAESVKAGFSSPISLDLVVDNSLEQIRLELLDELDRSSLDSKSTAILRACFFDYSTEQLAKSENVTVATMRTRISRARTKYLKVKGVAV
ncbi:sigma factor-like helix-turn-helix DNA-binding protein [Paenibacillus puldeungensis]|uniref:Sigma factor-like helix-turn-helix DNA-binding protein n=1 Tax=Paenibacillus puldeungensis TaxID=696536 RepID=A0ABW3RSA6_9BACL